MLQPLQVIPVIALKCFSKILVVDDNNSDNLLKDSPNGGADIGPLHRMKIQATSPASSFKP